MYSVVKTVRNLTNKYLLVFIYYSAGIFKQSMGARNLVGIIGLSYWHAMLHRLAE